mmetsp:Transcript_3429/g.12854  ORF Transcript_3429/g.12854 Transcript_3429/m.12854 type:complete len:325 (+) Transcript_3429:2185-3159(+)
MTCPHRPAAAAAALTSRCWSSLLTPCVHQLAAPSNLSCTDPGPAPSASSTYTPKSSPLLLSMTATFSLGTMSCCVNGHHRISRASSAAPLNLAILASCHRTSLPSSASNVLAPSSIHSNISSPLPAVAPPPTTLRSGTRGSRNVGHPWYVLAYLPMASELPKPAPPSATTTATTSYPRIDSTSSDASVVDIPPKFPSPTRIAGIRIGRRRSHCGVPLGPGEHTPPAVSTKAIPAPPERSLGPTTVSANCASWLVTDASNARSDTKRPSSATATWGPTARRHAYSVCAQKLPAGPPPSVKGRLVPPCARPAAVAAWWPIVLMPGP